MTKRLLSSAALWATIIVVIWFFRNGGAALLVGTLSVLALREFYSLLRASGQPSFLWLGLVFGGAITLSPWLSTQSGIQYLGDPALLLALAVVAFSLRILGERTAESRVEALGSTLFGLVYVSLPLQFLVRIIMDADAGELLTSDGSLLVAFWFVAVVKFCDAGALFSGMAFGRHKMAPNISPKKTWEGAAGGVLVSMGVAALGAWQIGAHVAVPPSFTPLYAALIAAPIAIAGIVSDLVESIIKRRAGSKDSGAGIPGIGGVFDLVDSLILAAPIGYLLLRLS